MMDNTESSQHEQKEEEEEGALFHTEWFGSGDIRIHCRRGMIRLVDLIPHLANHPDININEILDGFPCDEQAWVWMDDGFAYMSKPFANLFLHEMDSEFTSNMTLDEFDKEEIWIDAVISTVKKLVDQTNAMTAVVHKFVESI